jgi:hypothetical protein
VFVVSPRGHGAPFSGRDLDPAGRSSHARGPMVCRTDADHITQHTPYPNRVTDMTRWIVVITFWARYRRVVSHKTHAIKKEG